MSTVADLRLLIEALEGGRVSKSELLTIFNNLADVIEQNDLSSVVTEWSSATVFDTPGAGNGNDSYTVQDGRYWKSKIDGNQNHQPPTNLAISEDDYWIEVPKSTNNILNEWQPGLFGEGLVVVFYNDLFYKLNVGSRPYESLNIEAEIINGEWEYLGLKLIDEDDLASNSSTKAPSQQSVKAYVDGVEYAISTVLDTKADLVDGKISAGQLPSYVDDVLEFADMASFPGAGESGKIYVALDTGKQYRWGGSAYTEISPSEVNSVFGRPGVVVAQEADYQAFYPRFTQTYNDPTWINTLDGSKITGAQSINDSTLSTNVALRAVNNRFSWKQEIATSLPRLYITDTSNPAGNGQMGVVQWWANNGNTGLPEDYEECGWIGFGENINTFLNIQNLYDPDYGVKINNHTVWHAGNFGKSEIDALNIDADTFDGMDSSAFALVADLSSYARKDVDNEFTNGQTAAYFKASAPYELVIGSVPSKTRIQATASGGWNFLNSGDALAVDITAAGVITALGGSSTDWNTAFEYGDWSEGVDKAFVDALNIDAGTLDGLESTQFLRKDVNNQQFNGDSSFYLFADTTLGNDTKSIGLGSGGAVHQSRGASIVLFGIDHAVNPGEAIISPATGCSITLNSDTSVNGDLTLTGVMTAGGYDSSDWNSTVAEVDSKASDWDDAYTFVSSYNIADYYGTLDVRYSKLTDPVFTDSLEISSAVYPKLTLFDSGAANANDYIGFIEFKYGSTQAAKFGFMSSGTSDFEITNDYGIVKLHAVGDDVELVTTSGGNINCETNGLGALKVPKLTTTQRDALTAEDAMIIFNTSTTSYQGYTAGIGWQNITPIP
ncbi:MAG: hypothetical protein HWE07_09245 [Cytophagia bacterium]|nr:hypothetical protein [Cytophagia bacterium]